LNRISKINLTELVSGKHLKIPAYRAGFFIVFSASILKAIKTESFTFYDKQPVVLIRNGANQRGGKC
jgi:hypothetical protein